ncbi:hypothetical protein SKAU_G00303680 [Synaphobranchus kaupii]|uniref:Uncharacterized protein n=1 Tax=Synaphobranchus kaupii TaxID=118154 RepID=A0A9Q1EW81_SYNKA|nr:hypothetical protein SKAU_G00303680 [Synaphobranchus kaupii]
MQRKTEIKIGAACRLHPRGRVSRSENEREAAIRRAPEFRRGHAWPRRLHLGGANDGAAGSRTHGDRTKRSSAPRGGRATTYTFHDDRRDLSIGRHAPTAALMPVMIVISDPFGVTPGAHR